MKVRRHRRTANSSPKSSRLPSLRLFFCRRYCGYCYHYYCYSLYYRYYYYYRRCSHPRRLLVSVSLSASRASLETGTARTPPHPLHRLQQHPSTATQSRRCLGNTNSHPLPRLALRPPRKRRSLSDASISPPRRDSPRQFPRLVSQPPRISRVHPHLSVKLKSTRRLNFRSYRHRVRKSRISLSSVASTFPWSLERTIPDS
mmetsp:Transcript_1222/g.4525  ORF Transcript_1222/g.4525 Transcript_1222/m.4525 type:complete len:201 (+) Transcript_1222:455-1057(+)